MGWLDWPSDESKGMNMKYVKRLDRRTFLRGAGSLAIALPFLEEMSARSVYGAPAELGSRCVTLFFGHGVPIQFLQKGLVGPLSPLGKVKNKMSFYGGVHLNGGSGNGHETGGVSVFVARRGKDIKNVAGGPSIDQFLLKQKYPNGPGTPLRFLTMGSFFRRHEAYRYTHSWAEDGSPAEFPLDKPSEVWKRLFGGNLSAPPPGMDTGDAAKWAKYQKSVLDTALEDYKHLSGEAGGLGTQSRLRIKEHMDRLRELEQAIQLNPNPAAPTELPSSCSKVANVGPDPKLWEDAQSAPPNKPTIVPSNWTKYWDTMTTLYAMGLHCDLFRFGNVTFQGAAERAKFKGAYDYNGQTVMFNDSTDHHELWHAWSGNDIAAMNWHMHFILDQSVRFLQKLDDPAYPQANGKTFLESHLLLMSTELGNGAKHEINDVLHGVTGAGGKLKTGVVDANARMSSVDFYNTCLEAVGVTQKMGDLKFSKGTLSSLLA